MRSVRALLLLALVAPPVAAQDATDPGVPWRTSYFPYFTVSPNDGLLGIGRVLFFRTADYNDRVSLRDAVALEGGYSTKNTWLLRARGDFPKLADGWRLAASIGAGKQPRFGIPESPISRARVGGWVDVTRTIHGPLAFALRGGVDHQRVEGGVELNSRYPLSVIEASGCAPEAFCLSADQHIVGTDVNARAALVLDLRDREFETRNGALLEAGAFVGTGGSDPVPGSAATKGYDGGYGLARVWYSPRRGTRLTARLGMERVSHSAAIGIMQEIPAWESPVTVFGGPNSHRGMGIGAAAGRGGYLVGAEVRHDILNVGEIGAITAVAFMDAVNVYRDTSNPLADPAPGKRIPVVSSLSGWTTGLGGGIAIRVLRAAQLNITAARGEGVTRWYVSSGWSW